MTFKSVLTTWPLRHFYMQFLLQFPVASIRFLREVRGEMRKVNWLSRKEVTRYTLLVFSISFFVAAYLGALDFVLSWVLKQFIL